MHSVRGFLQHTVLLVLIAIALTVQPAGAQDAAPSSRALNPDTTAQSGNILIAAWSHPHMTIVAVPDTLAFLYRPQSGASVESLAVSEQLRGAVNGSFFEGVRGDARHAGWLSLYGQQITPLMDDRQLTHVVRISALGKTVTFLPVRSFAPSKDPGIVEFQTGPLVIENGVVREDLIQGSINGPSPHRRTLLATLDRSRLFFITVTDVVTLSELGAILRRLSLFRGGRLDVVNLDGGSSVALYLRDTPAFNFNAEDALPIVIGFH